MAKADSNTGAKELKHKGQFDAISVHPRPPKKLSAFSQVLLLLTYEVGLGVLRGLQVRGHLGLELVDGLHDLIHILQRGGQEDWHRHLREDTPQSVREEGRRKGKKERIISNENI